MSDPIDLYSDTFQMTVGPYGTALNFMVSPAFPPAPGAAVNQEKQATIRMSLEHLKVMTFLMHKHIRGYERATGVAIGIPHEVLNSLGIANEDWTPFWQKGGDDK